MKKNSLIIIIIATILLTSCASALKVEQPNRVSAPDTGINTLEDLEFIGFDGNSSVLPANIDFSGHTMYQSQFEGWKYLAMSEDIRKFGQSLENAKIAKNNTVTYTGIHDASRLGLYESKTRYVTYVQVQKNSWTFDETKNYLPFSILGPSLLAPTIPLLALGPDFIFYPIIFLGAGSAFTTLAFIKKGYTEIEYEGNFDVYVFDTKTKAVVYKDSVIVKDQQKFKGIYNDSDTNKNEVDNYYGTLIYNALIEKYQEVAARVADFE